MFHFLAKTNSADKLYEYSMYSTYEKYHVLGISLH